MDELSPTQVTLHDPFWSPRVQVNASRAIFHQWEQLEASGCFANFRIAAGEAEGWREGWFFADSDAHKWLDAASRICAGQPDPRLAAMMDDFSALLGRAQMPDGYLFTYNQIHFPGVRWANLQIEHELYCHGHLIEAGVSHHQATGRTDMLAIARKAADLLVRDFLGAGPERTPGHEEIEIALLRLHRVTGHAAYRDLARHFLEQRGRTRFFGLKLLRQMRSVADRGRQVRVGREAYLAAHRDYAPYTVPAGNAAQQPRGVRLRWLASALAGKYFQQHTPIRRQTVPVGHSVRFGYLQTAVAMLAQAEGDASLLPALTAAWEHMVTRRMYVTGGVGSLPALEGFGRDFELDPEYAYAETCAALASIFWSWQMALLTGEAKYSDLIEWQLYNAAAVGMGLAGDTYLYNNPLLCRGGVTRQPWYAVPCCPSNLSRTWADLGKYIYSVDGDTLSVHQWVGNQARLAVGVPVEVEIESGLPWQGDVTVRLTPAWPAEFTVRLRVPSWAVGGAAAQVNGEVVSLRGPLFEPKQSLPLAEIASEPKAPCGQKPLAMTICPQSQTASSFDPGQAQWITLRRRWVAGDEIRLLFDLPIIPRRADPRVVGHSGKVALTRGPLVYSLESIDNPGVDIFAAQVDSHSLRPMPAPDLLGGIMALRGQTTAGQPVTAFPYALWGNRGPSQMTVWVNE